MGINREFLQLAKNYSDFPTIHIGGWWVSEKLDGQRAWWDGGVTRGMPAANVPWANTLKDYRLREQPVATGLWSRYGKVIHAPDWWLDRLPKASLDGELWCGRGGYQTMRDIVGHHDKSGDWSKVKYMIFDSPHPSLVMEPARVNNPNFQKQFGALWYDTWFKNKGVESCGAGSVAESRLPALKVKFPNNEVVQTLGQCKLPMAGDQAAGKLQEFLNMVLDQGGEGLIIRDPLSLWEPRRIRGCLKVKPCHDSEATVIGYVWGRETDKGSKLLGLMGAIVVRLEDGTEFELSGFTDVERCMRMLSSDGFEEGIMNPGQRVTDRWTNPLFPIGSKITFTYRELTDDGVPKEARYLRRRDDE